MDVNRALWPSGRSRCVGEEVARFALELERRQAPGLAGDELVPPEVSLAHRTVATEAAVDDHVLHVDGRLVDDPFQRDRLAAPDLPSAVITILAPESWILAATAAAEKPEKIGTCTAPM